VRFDWKIYVGFCYTLHMGGYLIHGFVMLKVALKKRPLYKPFDIEKFLDFSRMCDIIMYEEDFKEKSLDCGLGTWDWSRRDNHARHEAVH
jgi:hypothetical protein